MSVRVMRYEIVGWSGEPKETKARWREIADTCREMVNTIWQEWEVWHVSRGHHQQCKEWYDAWLAYRREGGSKPKLDVVCMPPELSKHIRKVTGQRFRGLYSRTRDLLQQLTGKRMTGKDTEGKFNIWLAVLLNRQGRPNCTGDQPIPFDSQQATVSRDDKGYRLTIKLTRTEHDGKAGSIQDVVTLKARGSGAAIAGRIVDGEYKFCGSSIVYQSSRNKWFALVCYDAGENAKQELNPKLSAILHPSKDRPWRLWIDGRDLWIGGRGLHVESARRRLLAARWERQEAYREAGSSNKGHGRKRAMEGVTRLSNGWKNFSKTYNHQVTHTIVAACIERGIGRLVYLQPTGERHRNARFLSVAGKVPGRTDGTSWDYAQVATMLQYKCKDAGIHLEIRKCDASGRAKAAVVEPKKRDRSQSAKKGKAGKRLAKTG